LIKNMESYYSKTESKFDVESMMVSEWEINEVWKYVNLKLIKWNREIVDSYWLNEKKIISESLNNRIIHKLIELKKSRMINPYFVIKVVNGLIYVLFEALPKV
jgi:hypothetical protein